jgi:putative MATE family efflux protein
MTSIARAAGRAGGRALDRQILALAVPALGALVAEPLFLLTDTALVGHLGAAQLAGLGIAGVILQSVVGLLIFLAYATTPAVARRLGAGDRPGAIRAGIDGMWLALIMGVALALLGLPAAEPLTAAFGAGPEATNAATTYLTISLAGLPAMLLVIAASGLLRGLQDTRTPLAVAGVGFLVNAVLNAVLIYGAGLGIAGSALGTVLAQWGMAIVYIGIAVRAARSTGIGVRPGLSGVTGVAAAGGWLLLRTASLRAALLVTVLAGAALGVQELAALQVALTLFSTLAFVLDALAIAGQAMVGHGLGAADLPRVSAITRRLVAWGLWGGLVLGAVLACLSGVLPGLFTSDAEVARLLSGTLLVMALGIPLAGYVFVLDGVLIGAGDGRYLAWTGVLNLAVYLPLLALVSTLGLDGGPALVALWSAFGLGYIGARAVTLGLRARGSAWLVPGSNPSHDR